MDRNPPRAPLAQVALLAALLCGCDGVAAAPATGPPSDWPAYGRDGGGSRYAPLAEITRENVGRLQIAWTYRTGDLPTKKQGSSFEATPILVDGTLYLSTPFNRIIALDPETGAERWRFDPKLDTNVRYSDFTSRGVSTWLDPNRPAGAPCHRRIFHATKDSRLIGLDAATGTPCADFGENGQVDLGKDVGKVHAWEYGVTSPPAIIDDLVIVGSNVADNQRVDAPSGVVRAFDARTGVLRWGWDPIPPQARDVRAPAPDARYRLGTANAWSIISVDPERHLVFVPTGNTAPDYFGGNRGDSDYYSSSVVALRAATGEVVWRFQTVHHDLWDYDVPAQPTLITVRRDGKEIPAVAQATKMGHLFILDRETGVPLLPVEERPVPQTDVPGEHTSPTQPFPVAPPPLVPARLTPDDAWGLTPWDRGRCRDWIARSRSDGIFTPPSVKGSVMLPGNAGGTNWGSLAFDSVHGLMLIRSR